MKGYRNRLRLFARILLCVFVPMLLVASFHTHEPAAASADNCYACLHHLHHDGHLSSNTLSIDSCLLCHFLTTPFVASAAIAVAGLAAITVKSVSPVTAHVRAARLQSVSLRAPPACL